jgi:hypothetical protein
LYANLTNYVRIFILYCKNWDGWFAMSEKKYDVFLSYNSEDRDEVQAIAVYLADRAGLNPWLDRWQLIAGDPWLKGLEKGLSGAKSCAVFVGQSGQGPWQQNELAAALDLQAKKSGFRVIPVLLPSASAKPELPLFLAGNTWVEFRDLADDDAFWQLECGIRGDPPGRARPQQAEDRKSRQNRPKPYVNPADLIRPGGAMDVDSRFYIQRAADKDVFDDVKKHRGIVTIRGPRQTGKTSLMLRTYMNVRRMDNPLRSVLIDFQALTPDDLNTLNTIWRAIAVKADAQLELEGWEAESWRTKSNYDRNLSRFLDRFVFANDDTPVLLCMDEVDRVFTSPLRSAFFPSVRAFYNRGAYDPALKRVRWLLSTSSEPSFFIQDLTQSPFNIGLRVELTTFTAEETEEFSRRHGLLLNASMIKRIMEYLGGRPYLVHLLLYNMALHPESQEQLFDAETAGGGVFLNHLEHYVEQFQHESELLAAMKRVIAGKGCEDVKTANRLEAAGLVQRNTSLKVICHCSLYRDYLSKVL